MPSTITTSTTYNHSAVNSTATTPASPLVQSLFKRKTMSITQTYYLAHKARSKLSHEAARPDHNLRLLVGHANMLDSLMLELADAEREQESWFNQSVRASAPAPAKDRHVQWADTVVEEPEEDWEAEDAGSDTSSEASEDDSDDGFDAEDDDIEMADAGVVSLTRVPSNQISPPSSPETEEFDELDDEEDFAKLALVRTSSHHSTISSPPELDHDSDYSSEDESMPPSPPTTVLPAFTQDTKSAASSSPAEKSFYDDGYYLPPRNTSPASLVTAISVY